VERILERAARVWPFLLAFIALYLGFLAWFWWAVWVGSNSMTEKLAVGDSARDVITFTHAGLSAVGLGAFVWFFLAPRRNWLNGVIALSPYIVTWALVKWLGGSGSIVDPKDVYKYCSFDEDSLTIGGEFDLSPAKRKKPPPYYDPDTGKQLVPCTEARRRKQEIIKERSRVAAIAAQQQADDLKRRAELEQKRRVEVEFREDMQRGLSQLAASYAERAAQQVVTRVFENGQAITARIVSRRFDEQQVKLEMTLHIEWRGWFRSNRSYSTDGMLKVNLNGNNAHWQSTYVDGQLLAYMREMHPQVDVFAEYQLGNLGFIDTGSKSLFALHPGEERRVWGPSGTRYSWITECQDAKEGFVTQPDGEFVLYKNTTSHCTYTVALLPPKN
jgi:hypothetical protein